VEELAGIRASLETPQEADQAGMGEPGSSGTILLVEDEPALVEVISCMLQGVGYKVLGASSGEEALQVASHYRGKIHLLLTDVVLRGELRGPDLETELRKARPGIKCLLMSGYSQPLEQRENQILEKPFDRHTLLVRVREAFNQSK
jgi:DNA-binding NtrC family response regulator